MSKIENVDLYLINVDKYQTDEYYEWIDEQVDRLNEIKANNNCNLKWKTNCDGDIISFIKVRTVNEVRSNYSIYSENYFEKNKIVDNMDDGSWDMLFDLTYDVFKNTDNISYYLEAISYLNDYVVARTQVDGNKQININGFVNNLEMLENYGISVNMIKILKENMQGICYDNTKVISKNAISK